MEIHFSPEQETQLSLLADHNGTNTAQLIKEAALKLLDEDQRYRAAVKEGIAEADRGELLEPHEVWADVEKILRS